MRSTQTTTTIPEGYAQQARFRMWAHEQFVVCYLACLIKNGKVVSIGTHDGRFHADEIMAFAILICLITFLGGKWEFYRLDRDDGERLDQMDVLVDVGGEFDPSRGRFDHHQTGGAGCRYTRNGPDIPFSSCGLVWWCSGLFLTDENQSVFEDIDWNLVRGIDASDNGVYMPNGFRLNAGGFTRDLPGSPSHISEELGKLNNLPASAPILGEIYDPEAPKAEQRLAKFRFALQRAYASLVCNLEQARQTPEAREAIEDAMAEMEDGVLVLPHIRWQKVLFEVEGSRQVRIVVREVSNGYELKCLHGLKAPVKWRGKSNGELLAATPEALKGLKFCHHGGQIIGAATQEDAIEAAKAILREHRKVAA